MPLICAILFVAAAMLNLAQGAQPDPVLKDLDGIPRRPLDIGNKAASVLIFYWHDCPVCNSYAPEINRIYASYTNFAIYVVQVDPDLTPESAKKHAREYDLHPPVLLDPEHQAVKAVNASVTPQAIVLGKQSQVLYCGRIDNLYAAPGKRRAKATELDLRQALDAITAGKPIKKTETKAIGCLIEVRPR